jgi:hypothetical protein
MLYSVNEFKISYHCTYVRALFIAKLDFSEKKYCDMNKIVVRLKSRKQSKYIYTVFILIS